LERKNQPRVREWTNTHAHLSTRIIRTLFGLFVVEWRVCSMFGCCFRNPVRLRCCSSQYLCASVFTVNKFLTLFFWWQSHLGFSRIAFWAQALFLISCFFWTKTPGKNRKKKLARISTGLIVRKLPFFGGARCSFQQQISWTWRIYVVIHSVVANNWCGLWFWQDRTQLWIWAEAALSRQQKEGTRWNF